MIDEQMEAKINDLCKELQVTPQEVNQRFPHLHMLNALEIIKSERDGGIKTDHIPVGSVVLLETANSVYELKKTHDPATFLAEGGYFSRRGIAPAEVEINGSTWGRRMLKIRWIGVGMFVEFVVPAEEGFKTVTTTPVISCKITTPDGQVTEL